MFKTISNLKFGWDSITLMSESIENIVLLESNISSLKSIIIDLKKENSQFNSDIKAKEETLIKQKKWIKAMEGEIQFIKNC